MKVSELIEVLKTYDPDLRVVGMAEGGYVIGNFHPDAMAVMSYQDGWTTPWPSRDHKPLMVTGLVMDIDWMGDGKGGVYDTSVKTGGAD